MNTKNVRNKILYIFPIFFAVLTFVITMFRIPFWDETHAFEIARLNFFQILYLTRIEGHNILWYLILKPFSALDLYPYSMYIINWLFCSSAVFVLWKKSPFNIWIKLLIIFSTPFVFYFGTVARCYSVGILFLFLICSEFKNRYKKPRLFSVLLLICSNTSVLAFIPCFFIWIMYLYQLIKKKYKKFKIVFGFFVLNFILLFIQFFGVKKPNVDTTNGNRFDVWFFNFFNLFHDASNVILVVFKMTVYVLLVYGFIYLFKKSKYALYLFSSVYIALTALFAFLYRGSIWNHYFYYIDFIVLSWIFYKYVFSNRIIKFLTVSFYVCMFFSFLMYGDKVLSMTYTSRSRFVADFISKNVDKNAKLYCLDWWSDVSPGADMYLLRKGIEVYDVFGYKRTDFESIKNIFSYRTYIIDIGSFYDSLDKNTKNYIITDGTMTKNFKNGSDGNKYFLNPVMTNERLNIGIFELVKN